MPQSSSLDENIMQTIRRGASQGCTDTWFFAIVSHDDVDTNNVSCVADLKMDSLATQDNEYVVHDVIIAILARSVTIQDSLIKSTTSSIRREERWRDCNLDRQDLTEDRGDGREASSIRLERHARLWDAEN